MNIYWGTSVLAFGVQSVEGGQRLEGIAIESMTQSNTPVKSVFRKVAGQFQHAVLRVLLWWVNFREHRWVNSRER
jgi:hypothetical protein